MTSYDETMRGGREAETPSLHLSSSRDAKNKGRVYKMNLSLSYST